MSNSRHRQRGVALIVAILAVAIATMAAVHLTKQHSLYLRRTENLLQNDQAYQYALGAEAWAMAVLFRDARDSQTDALDEDWASVLPPIEIPGGFVTGRIIDLQGRFNLNNLQQNANPGSGGQGNDHRHQFERLLRNFQIEADKIEAIQDWMDADLEARGVNGAEDQYYLGLERPYRSGNQPFKEISELRLIKDIDDTAYRKLQPFITVLPQTTAINVNTAPMEVLASLGIDASIAAALVAEREETPFNSIDELRQHPLVSALNLTANNLSVASNYFLVEATATIHNSNTVVNSLLQRDNSGKIRVLYRFLGVL